MADAGEPKGNRGAEAGELRSRRDVMRLAGAVAAIGAGLGVTLASMDAQEKGPGYLQLKFYDGSNPEAILTYKFSQAEQARLLSVPRGRLQMKFHAAPERAELKFNEGVVLSETVPLDPVQVQNKLSGRPSGPRG